MSGGTSRSTVAAVQASPATSGKSASGAATGAGAPGNSSAGTASSSVPAASAQGATVVGQTEINQALVAGSDASGAAASALQAADAGAAAAVSAPTILATTATSGGAAAPAVSAVSAVSIAAPAAADSASLANDSSSHAHGDPGAGTGSDGAAALQQLAAAAGSPSSDSARTNTLRVQAPVDSPDFPQGVADRVTFAVSNDMSSAKLQVNPAQLGPIDLQIAVQGDRAQVVMSTHSAVTREALEASMPKLKEMLGSQGFTQVSVDISQRSFQDRSAFSQPYSTKPATGTSGATPTTPVQAASSASVTPRISLGAVDAYA